MDDEKQTKTERIYDAISRILLLVLATLAGIAAIWRMATRDQQTLNNIDGTTLLYLGVAGALVLLREVKTLAFGDYKLKFERVSKIAKEAKNAAENAQSTALGIGGQPKQDAASGANANEEIKPGTVPDDPWRGQFGGKAEHNNRRLEAEVIRVSGNSDIYSIRLTVRSTLSKQDPLQGVVQFFLHPTFRNPRPIVSVGPSGIAELKLRAWGAFTVGAVTDNGKTKLELNLAELENAPNEFRER
jgi:hypothetical protein